MFAVQKKTKYIIRLLNEPNSSRNSRVGGKSGRLHNYSMVKVEGKTPNTICESRCAGSWVAVAN